MNRFMASAAAALFLAAGSLSAQTTPPKVVEKKAEKIDKVEKVDKVEKMDHKEHAKMEKEQDKMDHGKQDKHHGMSPWKELDEFHMLVMDTWHPAKDKNDMTATRAKAGDLVKSAKTLAASTAPKGCDSPKVVEATKGLPAEAQKVADLVTKKADDATLKAALKTLHDKFEVAEGGCVMPKQGK
jgi:hypothetical protein